MFSRGGLKNVLPLQKCSRKILLTSNHTELQRRSGGGGTPVPPRHAPLGPPEPEAGSYILNSHIYSEFFTFLINRQWHNLSIL